MFSWCQPKAIFLVCFDVLKQATIHRGMNNQAASKLGLKHKETFCFNLYIYIPIEIDGLPIKNGDFPWLC